MTYFEFYLLGLVSAFCIAFLITDFYVLAFLAILAAVVVIVLEIIK